MSHIELACTECSATRAADMFALGCGECGAPLDVGYVEPSARTVEIGGRRMPVPFHSDAPGATMGEGGTPVIELPSVAESVGCAAVLGKLEFMNPTGSFKDRGTATMLSVALEHGVGAVVEDSSGNAGASVAAYSARAGIAARVFAPETAPEAKMGQIRVYEAATHPTPGPREASADAAIEYARSGGIVYASHNLSPYFVEGTKSFGYEVATEVAPAPDHIVIPVGNGSLLLGTWKAYQELIAVGAVDAMPKLHAVQADAVMPIAAAFAGKTWQPSDATTIAGGISVVAPPRSRQVLRALRDTGGTATAVSDARIAAWQRLLAAREGVFAEPTSAAAFAGLEALAQRGAIGEGDRVLLPVTGFGLKDAMPTRCAPGC